ncbi:formate dehydrogenase subunit gamma [Pseudomonas sp. GD04087]|uniref:formate dehydrogenase subunit gamma n=1 Tax=Pseudomonas TaxID=286 RepID=UPI001F31594D|nr:MULTISPECIES: formate dehydrogenase subunit gamma [Pseudomonas]MCP1652196.1 formate dehydrogenase subunit gamma [Pseudomonas nitroreducens]MCP1689706.1 formate dehydrogenase subunit gamma [Pseudomonas nitroreducens]MDH0289774.1 formate dehydrogenase subunit gamma [Pseudomonas sp. GD04087]MDH1049752.1 formate dehydrogenase subunit gamma [Pseudomonas sp. GD03903]MDH2002824.1 formate dehydrogenase subunit gamma [Pseudomonas sp. GD03691]
MKKDIQRYNANERSNHWMVAILFFLAGLSGLALFHPAMFWLTNLFGGGPWTRILHPFLGVAMFLFFLGLVIRFAHHNLVEKRDVQWLKQWRDVVTNREENLPEVGRYNAGQKLLFWTLLLCMLVLLVTGLVMWRAYFSHFFGIDIIRVASLLHAFAAFVLICSILVHIYAGIWVKGSMGAMLYGWVSRGWARKHHAAWLKDVDKGKGH